jgi:midasin (ATPase involved in ribosome maturation)
MKLNYYEYRTINNTIVNSVKELEKAIKVLLNLSDNNQISIDDLREKAKESDSIPVKILMEKCIEYHKDLDEFASLDVEIDLSERLVKYFMVEDKEEESDITSIEQSKRESSRGPGTCNPPPII